MKIQRNKSVLIRLRSNGMGKLVSAANTVERITQTYTNGTVKVESGDTWSVKPWGGPDADFVAVK